MELENLTPNIIDLGQEHNMYVVDYKQIIPYGSNTDISLFLRIDNPKNFSSAQCGCLTVKGELRPDGVLLRVSYNSKIKGEFRKKSTIKISNETVKIQFRGEVV